MDSIQRILWYIERGWWACEALLLTLTWYRFHEEWYRIFCSEVEIEAQRWCACAISGLHKPTIPSSKLSNRKILEGHQKPFSTLSCRAARIEQMWIQELSHLLLTTISFLCRWHTWRWPSTLLKCAYSNILVFRTEVCMGQWFTWTVSRSWP